MKRGSIALARSLCYEIAGPTDEDDDITGSDYGSVDIAEILSAEVERLRAAICATLDANGHLADGEVCTLLALKVALRESGAPWAGDELHNPLNDYAVIPMNPTTERRVIPEDVRKVMEMVLREVEAVANDHHHPRYTRLDEAITALRNALNAAPKGMK